MAYLGVSMSQLAPALLEQWMREFYFAVEIDLGSSCVEDFSFSEIRRLTGLTHDELDRSVLRDSCTLGDPGLRQAIADHLGVDDPECVVPTHGSSEAIFLAMQALLEPGGGGSCFPQLNEVGDVERFCRRLADEANVMLVPGKCFGHERHVRLGFGGPSAQLREGLSRISDLL